MKDRKNRNKIFGAAGILFLVSAWLLRQAAGSIPGFADQYGTYIYPVLAGTIGRAAGIFPFSAVEFGLYGLIIFCIFYGIKFRKQPVRLISRTVFLLGLIFFSYVSCCGVNYYRTAFSEYAGIERQEASVEELKEMCLYLTEKVNEYKSCAGKRLSLKEYGEEGRLSLIHISEPTRH